LRALWLEDGLAKATLDSYRSDLGRLGLWLADNAHEPLLDIRETTLTAFIAHLAKKTRATSQARYLSTLRRFYRWQVGRGRIVVDPTLKLANPSRPSRLPKVMSEKQVEALLDAPDLDAPLGLRDRAMLETSMPPACASRNWSISSCTKSASPTASCAPSARAARNAWCRSANWPSTGYSATSTNPARTSSKAS
jgi:hypothetical protein